MGNWHWSTKPSLSHLRYVVDLEWSQPKRGMRLPRFLSPPESILRTRESLRARITLRYGYGEPPNSPQVALISTFTTDGKGDEKQSLSGAAHPRLDNAIPLVTLVTEL
jgi:hypothetical protein